MWHQGRETLSKKDKQLAKRVRKGAPTVSARRIPPLTLTSEDVLSPTCACNGCWFTAWWDGKSPALVYVVFVRKVARRCPRLLPDQDACASGSVPSAHPS